MKCPKCGKKIAKPDLWFCSGCGKPYHKACFDGDGCVNGICSLFGVRPVPIEPPSVGSYAEKSIDPLAQTPVGTSAETSTETPIETPAGTPIETFAGMFTDPLAEMPEKVASPTDGAADAEVSPGDGGITEFEGGADAPSEPPSPETPEPSPRPKKNKGLWIALTVLLILLLLGGAFAVCYFFTDLVICHHTYEETVLQEPTCVAVGVRELRCGKCGNHYQESIPKDDQGHAYECIESVEPSCLSTGSKSYVCSLCNALYDEMLPALGHNEVHLDEKKPTCTENGQKEGTYCDRCGKPISGCDVIAMLGHDFTVEETPATCANPGTRTQTCSRCGIVSVTNIIVPHTFEGGSCTEAAVCTVCGAKGTEPPGHHYVVASKNSATCTSAGSVRYTCSRCGDTKTETTDPALGHNIVNRKCTRCGQTFGPNLRQIYYDLGAPSYCQLAGDESYLYIDTNPNDYDDYLDMNAYNDIGRIISMLDLPESLMVEMSHTRALDGKQIAEYDYITVTWTYHPDQGLEVIFKIK